MEVYWLSGSPPSWRVLLTLEVKNIAYESRLLEASKGDLKAPAFRALNPRGKVPTLRDGDFVLAESLAIMAYLDRKFPEPPLFGRNAEETGRIWKTISDGECYLLPAAARITLPVFFGQTAEQANDMRDAIPTLHAELKLLDEAVGVHEWLAGRLLSAADIASHPGLEALLRAAGKPTAAAFDLGLLPFAERYPALAGWRERMAALPRYERTYPPHWRAAA